jgi:hypothetical protein
MVKHPLGNIHPGINLELSIFEAHRIQTLKTYKFLPQKSNF